MRPANGITQNGYTLQNSLQFLPAMARVEIKTSPTVPNTIDVRIEGETHTAAAAIVERLNSISDCGFAAYRVDHPDDSFVHIRVQGSEARSARDILKQALTEIMSDLDDMSAQLNRRA